MVFRKLAASVYLAVGIFNIGLWIVLIITGQVESFQEEKISFVFHWASELGMAIMLIITGIRLFKVPEKARSLFFFSSGLLLIAIIGALAWYLVHFDPAMVAMGAVITAMTLLLVIIQPPGGRDMVYLLTGIILYGTINVAGEALQKGLSGITLYNGLLLAATVMLTSIIWKNKGILKDGNLRES
jgi:hypothetical protein